MYIIKNKQYEEEIKNFNLHNYCDNCRYYCKERDLCAMLYPTSPHKQNTFLKASMGERIYFCKMFEAE